MAFPVSVTVGGPLRRGRAARARAYRVGVPAAPLTTPPTRPEPLLLDGLMAAVGGLAASGRYGPAALLYGLVGAVLAVAATLEDEGWGRW